MAVSVPRSYVLSVTHNRFGQRGPQGRPHPSCIPSKADPARGDAEISEDADPTFSGVKAPASVADLRKAPMGSDLTSFTLLCALPYPPVGIVTQEPPRCTGPTDRTVLVTDAKFRKSSGVCFPYFLFCPKIGALELEDYVQPFINCATFQGRVAHEVQQYFVKGELPMLCCSGKIVSTLSAGFQWD